MLDITTLKNIMGLLIFVVLLAVVITTLTRLGTSGCWKDTLAEIDHLTAPKTAGIGACVGRETFVSGVELRSGCTEKIVFADYDACRDICEEKRAAGQGGEKCFNTCASCQGSTGNDGCIIAVPIFTSAWDYLAFWKADETFGKRTDAVTVYSTGKYHFQGERGEDIVLTSPAEGTTFSCRKFEREKEGTTYTLTPQIAGTLQECEISVCTPSGLV